jgi:hypothetical protein
MCPAWTASAVLLLLNCIHHDFAAAAAVAAAAAYGGHEAVADLGNQIFITMRKGTSWPPAACDIRVRYDQTIGDLKAAVSAQMGIPAEQQQLFWHKKELTAAYDERTLLDMNMHTGFAIKGYDLVRGSHLCEQFVAGLTTGVRLAACSAEPTEGCI